MSSEEKAIFANDNRWSGKSWQMTTGGAGEFTDALLHEAALLPLRESLPAAGRKTGCTPSMSWLNLQPARFPSALDKTLQRLSEKRRATFRMLLGRTILTGQHTAWRRVNRLLTQYLAHRRRQARAAYLGLPPPQPVKLRARPYASFPPARCLKDKASLFLQWIKKQERECDAASMSAAARCLLLSKAEEHTVLGLAQQVLDREEEAKGSARRVSGPGDEPAAGGSKNGGEPRGERPLLSAPSVRPVTSRGSKLEVEPGTPISITCLNRILRTLRSWMCGCRIHISLASNYLRRWVKDPLGSHRRYHASLTRHIASRDMLFLPVQVEGTESVPSLAGSSCFVANGHPPCSPCPCFDEPERHYSNSLGH